MSVPFRLSSCYLAYLADCTASRLRHEDHLRLVKAVWTVKRSPYPLVVMGVNISWADGIFHEVIIFAAFLVDETPTLRMKIPGSPKIFARDISFVAVLIFLL